MVLSATILPAGVSAMAQSSVTLSVDTLGTTASITSVARGTAVTLRARVTTSSSGVVYPGTVSFIDTSLPSDTQTVGTAQLLPNGTAALSLMPASGSHSYRAAFNGTKTNPAAVSPTETLGVTGVLGSAVTLVAAGTTADYTLTATVSGDGFGSAPTGTVNFLDTSNGNAVVGTANLSSATFATSQVAQAMVTTGTTPSAVATGDLNGDGIPDAVIANAGDGTLTVMLGNGDGTFTPGTTIPTGGRPTSVIAADLNNDGNLDLAVVDNQNGKVLIYLGNGNGTFTVGTSITVGTSPYGIAAGDLNLDGNLDLVVTMDGANTAAVLLGAGNGTFTVGTPVPVGALPRGVVIADFNHDGNPDIATANFGDSNVSVALGAGDGTFTKASNSPFNVGNGPIALAAADLNGDGHVDLAVANQTDGTVDVLLGGGGGNFALTGLPLTVGSQPSAIAAADLNNTGAIDLMTANSGSGTLSFLSNNGNATFAAAVPITAGAGADALAAADLIGEGRPGLIVANGGAANASVFLPAQAGSVNVTNISFAAAGPHMVVAAYSGDSNFGTSTSSPASLQAANVSPTTTLLQDSFTSNAYGTSVTFTATVTPNISGSGVPTGSVSFFDGTTLLGSVTMTGAVATFSTTALTVGSHTITANYLGNLSFGASTSNSIAQTVGLGTLHVTANHATRAYGAADPTFTSTITGARPGDTFTVTYTTNETVTSPAGAYTITPLAQGPTLSEYTVVYTAGVLTVAPATLTIAANNATRVFDTPNPAFTGAVNGAVNGDTFTLSFSTTAVMMSDVGAYAIVPAVIGSALANYSVVVVDGTLTITPATGIVLTAGNATRVYGTANPVFTGTVSGSFANLGLLVSGTTPATPASNAGTYAIVPVLTGLNPADYVATLIDGVLTISPAESSVVLVSGNTTAAVGTNVNLTATVSSATTGTPTGLVFFYTGTTFLGASPLSGGFAALTTNAIPAGTNTVTARYNGNTDFTASVSNSVTETITQGGAATLLLTASSTTTPVGFPVVLTATLTGQNGIVPTGNVLFFDGATLLGTVASVNGTATLTVLTLATGTHTLTSLSAGDANYGPALSNTVTETITAGGGTGGDYTITATPSSLTIKQGSSASVTVTVTPVNGYTGQITLGCVTLPQNASCNFAPVTFTLNGTTPVTVTLTVNTSSSVAGLLLPAMPGRAEGITSLAGFAMLPAMLLAGIFGWRRRSGFAGMRLLALLLAVTTMVSLSGCGSGATQSGTGNAVDTPLGTSTITVTATPQNSTTGPSHTMLLVISVTH